MPRDFRDADPRDLRVPASRRSGADPFKLHQQIAQFGASAAGMPLLWVYEAADGVLVVYNRATRARRIAKLAPSSCTATTLSIAAVASSARLVVNCGSSSPHPVFIALWYSRDDRPARVPVDPRARVGERRGRQVAQHDPLERRLARGRRADLAHVHDPQVQRRVRVLAAAVPRGRDAHRPGRDADGRVARRPPVVAGDAHGARAQRRQPPRVPVQPGAAPPADRVPHLDVPVRAAAHDEVLAELDLPRQALERVAAAV